MPTDAWFKANPKISGYVPQPVYDCLIKFKDERSVSISQAVTIVLSEYFGVNQRVDQSSFAGVTLSQVQELERGLASLAKLVEQRFQELENKIESFKVPSNLMVDQSKLKTQSDSSNDESNLAVSETIQALEQDEESELTNSGGELLSEPLDEEIEGNTQTDSQDVNTVLLNEPQNKLLDKELRRELNSDSKPSDEPKVDSDLPLSLLSEPLIKPLSAILLAQRLNCHSDTLSKIKSKLSEEDFYEWTASKDPDGIAWKFLKKGRKYLPTSELSDELLSKLLSWIEQNNVIASHSAAVPTAQINFPVNE